MKQSHPQVGLARLCGLFGVTRQAYYQNGWRQLDLSVEQATVLDLVQGLRKDQPRLGTKKLYLLLEGELKKHQIKMGRDALFSLLGAHGLLIRRRRRGPKTTDSKHRFRRYENLVEGFVPTAPDQLLVGDITYIRVGDGFAYLALLTDAYSRRVQGHRLSDNLKVDFCAAALKLALKKLPKEHGLIHHSDRGIQYCHQKYIKLLNGHNVRISMTQNGDPYENALAERVNGILKGELLQKRYPTFREAQRDIDKAIKTYNENRPHMSCDYLTPNQAHKMTGKLKKHWKNKNET